MMTIIKGAWSAVRGTALFVTLAVIFTCVIAVSCFARLFSRDGSTEVAGRLRLGS